MFWALARVSFRAAKIVSCNKNFFFMVYDQNYHNCSTLSRHCFEMTRQVTKTGAVNRAENVVDEHHIWPVWGTIPRITGRMPFACCSLCTSNS
jgi:hypothetical protein